MTKTQVKTILHFRNTALSSQSLIERAYTRIPNLLLVQIPCLIVKYTLIAMLFSIKLMVHFTLKIFIS